MVDLGKKIGSFVTGTSLVKLILRQKSDQEFELGQLFLAGKDKNEYSIYQIKDLFYGSQIPDNVLELMAGYGLERERSDLKVYEPELRNYVLALARPLIFVKDNKLLLPKRLPNFFSDIFDIDEDYLDFFKEEKIENPLNLGNIRSGSRVLKAEVKLEATDVLKHHILIPATTGRGKSNLVKTILYNLMENENCGKLVFDPHNEYYGIGAQKGLKEHPDSSKYIEFYTIRSIPGKLDLKFNVNLLEPIHAMGSLNFTQPQIEALVGFFRLHRENWIQAIFSDDKGTYGRPTGLAQGTLDVIRRRLSILLNFGFDGNNNIIERGIFTLNGYESTISNIVNSLIQGKTVIIDTSLFEGTREIFVATIIVENIFNEYKRLKFRDQLEDKPVITIVLEEAPRVIGKKVLETRDNVFGKIAREGRKFNIGLIGITQLPSLIDREILANMNTKIILGNEMGPERRTLIESSAQDLSDDSQTIASLDIGEAIVTSNFTKFAIPIKILLFEDLIEGKTGISEAEKKIKKRSPGF
ncbi:MAG: ATP-binding protein [Promethearchaeota archaeon]|jgi:DNA helicase HerA-like ATPase